MAVGQGSVQTANWQMALSARFSATPLADRRVLRCPFTRYAHLAHPGSGMTAPRRCPFFTVHPQGSAQDLVEISNWLPIY
jgi:hypothetical protein